MGTPTFTDYVHLLFTLFERFLQQAVICPRRGHPFVYQHQVLIVFFVIMQQRRIFQFKAQHRWVAEHPELSQQIGLASFPSRSTLSRRYKALTPVIEDFIAFIGQAAETLDPRLDSHDVYEDKSLFKAQGPVWHQSDRQAGRVPEKLRHLDTDASWGKSGYHGWVYGYGLHLTCNRAGFPKLVRVEPANVSESQVLDEQADYLLHHLRPDTLTADNTYTQASRIRQWASEGVVLLTPALKWVKGRFATAYHHFIEEPVNAHLLQSRRTAIEPMFDLIAKVIGTTAKQKQLPLQKLVNVRTCLALAALTIQVAMIANSIWRLPLRNISTMTAVFT